MVMNCETFQENASRFMDGLLDASGQAALFAHLSSCADCRSFLASSVRTREVIRKDTVALPEGLDEELFEQLSGGRVFRLASHGTPEPFWRREIRFSYPLAAAAVLVVALASVLFSLLLFRSGGAGPTFESVFRRDEGTQGRQTVVVIYQLPEEQVVTTAPADIFEVRARTVAN
jgi:hypothetical protein